MILAYLSPYSIHIQMSDNFLRTIFCKWKTDIFPAYFAGKNVRTNSSGNPSNLHPYFNSFIER